MAQFPNVLAVTGATFLRDPIRLLLSLRTRALDNGRHVPVVAWRDLFPTLSRLGLDAEDVPAGSTSADRPPIHHTHARLWVRSRQSDLDDARIAAIRDALGANLDWVGPVYHPPGLARIAASECPLPHVVVIRPRSSFATGELDELPRLLERYGLLEIPEKSRYLGGLRYFVLEDPARANAYELRPKLMQALPDQVADVLFEFMPMAAPYAAVPDDTLFPSQWALPRIQAPEAWDIGTGASTIIIAIIDGGCDLTHEDLAFVPDRGLDLATMSGDGSPLLSTAGVPITHGTFVAGVAAATMNNRLGVAGVAGGCLLLPLASTFTDMEMAAGIRYALDEDATVINMSIYTTWRTFLTGPIPAALEEAERRGCVLVGSAGDGNGGAGLVRPGEHPLVMACGATDMADERWIVRRDGSVIFESSWGDSMIDGVRTGVSVMAPGERIFTTDLMGGPGATPVNYTDVFIATSASAPFVAGLAALLQSTYATLRLDPARIRSVIERTAEKVGPLPYVDMEGFPHGTRNPEFGYGRINAYRAMDLGDVMIRDWSGDDGREPSTPPGGNFYAYSDIVVRPTDDDEFLPDDIIGSSTVVRGQPAYVYVQVHNVGPAVARSVSVDVRLTSYVGLEFVYPDDWRLLGDTHVQPESVSAALGDLPPGVPPARAKFALTVEQVERLWNWTELGGHPCILAQVTAANDYAFGGETLRGADLIVRRNNIAQRNLSVMMMVREELRAFRFVAGNRASAAERIDLVVRCGALARRGEVRLCLDRNAPFDPGRPGGEASGCDDDASVFLDPTRVEVCLGGRRVVLTLEAGSRFVQAPPRPRLVSVQGGKFVDDGRTCLQVTDPVAVVGVSKAAYGTVPLTLEVRAPAGAQRGDRFLVDIAQQSQGRTVGGAVAVFVMS